MLSEGQNWKFHDFIIYVIYVGLFYNSIFITNVSNIITLLVLFIFVELISMTSEQLNHDSGFHVNQVSRV